MSKYCQGIRRNNSKTNIFSNLGKCQTIFHIIYLQATCLSAHLLVEPTLPRTCSNPEVYNIEERRVNLSSKTLFQRKIFIDFVDNIGSIHYPTGTPHEIDVDSMSILRRYIEDQISTNFHVIFSTFSM